jgi:hypothetical protein
LNQNFIRIFNSLEWKIGEIFEKIKFRAEIKKLALTLYLDETNLINRRVEHNVNSKLSNVEIETFELVFRQSSDSSYKATARIKNFLFDDLRETHKQDAVIHMINRHFTVDPNAYMLIASLDFKSKERSRLCKRFDEILLFIFNSFLVSAQLESLYICIKLDYLMILRDFFMSDNMNRSKTTKVSSEQNQLDYNDIETGVDILVKNPEIVLLEDQHNSNSNCLVLNVS